MHRFRRPVLAATLLTLVSGAALAQRQVPFEWTEQREDCESYDPLKQPFFGVTHLHTGLSFDAGLRFVPSKPRDAYAFAKGEAPLPGTNAHGDVDLEMYPPLERPIDWGAVTDHSEFFGEIGVCRGNPSSPGYYSLECQLLRGFYYQPGTHLPPDAQRLNSERGFGALVMPNLGPSSFNSRLPLCVSGEADCVASELEIWAEMQNAAEEAYDRTKACRFTSFVGYEVTSTPGGTNWHRNVLFRNAHVVERPITTIDMARKKNPDPDTNPPTWLGPQIPAHLWNGLERECQPPCEALTIPHNSNVGGGVYTTVTKKGKTVRLTIVPPMFFDPLNAADAAQRQRWEPLVEIYQDKGSSECRWDPRTDAPSGVDTTDEHCAFELLETPFLSGAADAAGDTNFFPPRSWVRNVLKDGLKFQQTLGVNPFKLGIVASSDSHDGTMGWHPEDATFHGHKGIEDFNPTRSGPTIQNSSGGHSVVWAEENSRDAIFHALKNKETYGTSGTRPIVRFFGGWNFAEDLCGGEFVKAGYEGGVPMGGDLPAPEGDGAPRFITAAWMDDYVGTPLQQIQIVKGWVETATDSDGKEQLLTREKVYTVAGNDRQAGVSESCERTGTGYKHLCAVWEDPHFDRNQQAFYYVRVLENPVCRYSTHICQQDYGVNPLLGLTQCNEQLEALRQQDSAKAANAAACCSNETTTPIVQPVIQERAWTSPIWYTPR